MQTDSQHLCGFPESIRPYAIPGYSELICLIGAVNRGPEMIPGASKDAQKPMIH
ncbi:hypothetical protein D779_2477 [Imhoffiella purpurea]|uniref:Uncharacterized protein n=1 Tax=Imhoffiella purpurea TaxID=1249627 RepID=W9VIN9_9GAMM|nr:hypothetical protein D779_2477 [Imhoffiella purpurea]